MQIFLTILSVVYSKHIKYFLHTYLQLQHYHDYILILNYTINKCIFTFTKFQKGNFQAKYNGKWRRSFEDAKDSLGVGQLVDSRGTDKYNAGHIKGAASLPFPTLFENGVLKEPDQLKKGMSG